MVPHFLISERGVALLKDFDELLVEVSRVGRPLILKPARRQQGTDTGAFQRLFQHGITRAAGHLEMEIQVKKASLIFVMTEFLHPAIKGAGFFEQLFETIVGGVLGKETGDVALDGLAQNELLFEAALVEADHPCAVHFFGFDQPIREQTTESFVDD